MLVLPVARPLGGSRPVMAWITVFGTCQVAMRSNAVCERTVALTSTSTLGTVYDASPRMVVWNGWTSRQLRRSLIVVWVVPSITRAVAQVFDDPVTQTTIKDLRNCRSVDPFQTTVRGLASYTVPKIDVLVSGTVRSQPALPLTATWAVPNTLIQSITGRLPPGGVASGNTSFDILDNDHRLYADNRRTQVDMRFAKILRFGKRRADIGVDLGNLLNTNYATTYENTYQYSVGNTAMGGTWNNPTAIYTPRFVRWNLTVDF